MYFTPNRFINEFRRLFQTRSVLSCNKDRWFASHRTVTGKKHRHFWRNIWCDQPRNIPLYVFFLNSDYLLYVKEGHTRILHWLLVWIRETREGWPLLTVETEVRGDSKEHKSFLGWFVRLIVLVQNIFFLPWLLYSAQYKIFFSSPYTISVPLSPSPSKLGRQSCWVARLLVCVSCLNKLCYSKPQ